MPETLLFAGGAFRPDPWTRLDDAAPLPADGHAILTLDQWARLRDGALRSGRAFGLALAPGTPLEPLAADLPRFALVALTFPKFSDGRAYSMARQLRHDHGFSGEIRATGDVLFDQLQLMARCGFDAFEITDAATRRLLEAGRRPGLDVFTQPSLGTEGAAGLAWRRRSLA